MENRHLRTVLVSTDHELDPAGGNVMAPPVVSTVYFFHVRSKYLEPINSTMSKRYNGIFPKLNSISVNSANTGYQITEA